MDLKVVKYFGGTFVIWKSLVNKFTLLGKWLVWNIGRGRKLKFRKDPWMGCK
jgi:hypothetical protein